MSSEAPSPPGRSTAERLAAGEERDRSLAEQVRLLRDELRRLEARLWAIAMAGGAVAGAAQGAVAHWMGG